VDDVHAKVDLFAKKTPYWQIFQKGFPKAGRRVRN